MLAALLSKPWLRALLLLVVVGVVAPLWGAAAIEVEGRAGYPEFMETAAYYVTGVLLLIVLGILILWAVASAMRQDYTPAIVVFAGIFLLSMSGMIFFGGLSGGGFFGLDRDAARTAAAVDNYDWVVYGENDTSPAHYASQAVSYDVQKGWALAGASFFFRLIDFGFSSLLIPTILFGGSLFIVFMSQYFRHWRPLLVHLAFLMLLGYLLLWPSVQLEAPDAENPVARIMLTSFEDEDGLIDAPRVTPIQALTFQLSTSLFQKLGETLTQGASNDPNTVIYQAALDAHLDDGDIDAYLKYAAACMTAVKSALVKRDGRAADAAVDDFYARLAGTTVGGELEGTVGRYQRAPLYARHAFSPFADSMFSDLWLQQWVYEDDWQNEDFQWFDGLYGLSRYPDPHSFHPNPDIGGGYLVRGRWNAEEQVIQHTKEGQEAIDVNILSNWGVFPVVQDFEHVMYRKTDIVALMDRRMYMPFCSIAGFTGSGPEYLPFAQAAPLPPITESQIPSEKDRLGYVPMGIDDILRHRIARRYLGDNADNWCLQEVSPDRQNEHLWGCLLAGRYRKTDTIQERAMSAIQETFDRVWRPMLIEAYEADLTAAGADTRERPAVAGNWWTSGTFEADKWDFLTYREFMDMWMMAPGVQSQIGMRGEFKEKAEITGDTDSWLFSFITMVVGPIVPTVAGIFAAICTFLAKIALMVYPHVIGVMTFYLMMAFLPYAVFSLLPGRYFFWLEWSKTAVVVCLMPVFCQFGLALMEKGNAIAQQTFFVRSQGGGDFGEALMTLFGAMFILGSYSFASGVVTLGFGSLSSTLGTINSSAFKLTGAGIGAMLTAVGIVGAMVTKGATAKLGMGLLGGKRNGIDPTGLTDGGTGTPRIPGGGGDRSPGGAGGVKTIPGPAERDRAVGHADFQARALTDQLARSAGEGVAGATAGLQAGATNIASMVGGHDLASGLAAGRSMAGTAGSAVVAGGVAVTGVARMAAERALASLRRRGDGRLDPSVGPDAEMARTAEQVAHSHLSDASLHESQGNVADGQASRLRAAAALRDASRLEVGVGESGRMALRSGTMYLMGGDVTEARAQHTAAVQLLDRGIARAATERERGELMALRTEASALGMRLDVSGGGSAQGGFHEVLHQAGRADQVLGGHIETVQAGGVSSFDQWSSFAAGQMARLRVAETLDTTNAMAVDQGLHATRSKAVDTFLGGGLGDLAQRADAGDRQAAVVHGAILAGAGRMSDANLRFSAAGIEVSAEDARRIRQDLDAGRFSAVDRLLRRLG